MRIIDPKHQKTHPHGGQKLSGGRDHRATSFREDVLTQAPFSKS
jgi:hypothetical protein